MKKKRNYMFMQSIPVNKSKTASVNSQTHVDLYATVLLQTGKSCCVSYVISVDCVGAVIW